MKKISFLILCLSFALISCGAGVENKKVKEYTAATKSGVEQGVLNIYSFHSAKRCYTCMKIEELTKEVVKELSNDKIKLVVIDISDRSNAALVDKYEVSWSSLILDNGVRANNLTKMAFSYAKSQGEEFKRLLRAEITKML